jgi:Fic-DOC domain mobile mystery protein B
MLGDVWRWAGRFRTSERNIGIDYWQIPIALRQLLDDTKAWIEYHTYPPDEIALRFHHRLVQIHPFPNGNGRHSRFMADLLAIQLGRERFSWGRERLRDAGAARERYIEPCAPLTITTSVLCWRSRGHSSLCLVVGGW